MTRYGRGSWSAGADQHRFHHLLELGARDRKRHAGTETADHVEHANVVEGLR